MEKKCSRCKNVKSINNFYNNKSQCKDCYRQYNIDNNEQIKQRKRDHYKTLKNSNKSNINEKTCSKCKINKSTKEFYRSENSKSGFHSHCKTCVQKSEKIRLQKQDYVKKEECREYRRKYYAKRRDEDPTYRIGLNVCSCIRNSIVKYSFSNSKIQQLQKKVFSKLPYTPEQLKQHIESLWESWMNWENYGLYNKDKKTWQIDHIIPKSKLKYKKLDDPNFQKCWALENLRPLETVENIKKRDKIIQEE